MAYSTRARALTAADDPHAALDDLHKALADAELAGDPRSVAFRLRRLGEAYLHPAIADYDRAIEYFTAAAEAMATLHDTVAHAHVRTLLAKAYLAADRPCDALEAMRSADADLASWGSPRHRAAAFGTLGRVHAALGNLAEARRCLGTALETYPETGPGSENRGTTLALYNELGTADSAPP
jgi:tetratricopeptide (TPR) repeat protein